MRLPGLVPRTFAMSCLSRGTFGGPIDHTCRFNLSDMTESTDKRSEQ